MPDLSELFRSQPGWVVVAVILILAAAYVLRPVLTGRYGRAEDDDEDDEQTEPRALPAAPTGGPGRTYDAILDALDRLHEVATREAARGDEAERERDELSDRLRSALRDLAECERAAVGPVRDAHRYAGRRDVDPADPPRTGGRRRLVEPGPPPRADHEW